MPILNIWRCLASGNRLFVYRLCDLAMRRSHLVCPVLPARVNLCALISGLVPFLVLASTTSNLPRVAGQAPAPVTGRNPAQMSTVSGVYWCTPQGMSYISSGLTIDYLQPFCAQYFWLVCHYVICA